MLLRAASRLPLWAFAAFLLTLADLATPPTAALYILHLPLLMLAWRWFTHRRTALLMALLLAGATIPGVLRALEGQPPEMARWWTLVGLAVGGMYQSHLQLQRRRRVRMRRQLHASVRRRTRQLQRSNRRLRTEVARRQTAQQQLAESEAHLESLIQRLGLHVIRKNGEGVFTYASPSFCRLLGRSVEEVVGHTDEDFYPPLTSQKYRQDDLQVMQRGEPIDTVEVNPQPDGSRSYVQVLKAPEYDPSGALVGIQAVFWDVTDRYRSEAELRRSEVRKRALFQSTADGILLIDAEGRIVESNAAAGRIFSIAAEALDGRLLEELALPVDRVPPWRGGEINRRLELMLRRADGQLFPAELSAHPIPLGEADGMALVVRDITDRKQSESELRAAKETAEAANRAKDSFLAGVSHEIRTPLGAILGLAELLADSSLTPRQRQYVDLISHSAGLLQGAIDDILDFSKIQANRLQLECEPLDLVHVVGDATKCLAARAVGKGLELVFDVHPGLARNVAGDAIRLRQVVVNLVGNAVKFTDTGEVVVRLRPGDAAPESAPEQSSGGAWLEVIDSGIGIPEERRRTIFEAFEQADSSTTRRFGGTGLGLAISDRIVRHMGGEIIVESSPGEGSAFRCRLPLRPVETDQAAKAQTGEVWVIEDNPHQSTALRQTLSGAGYTTCLFDTAEAALAAAKTRRPDHLIVDAQLEGLAALEPLLEGRRVVWTTHLGALSPRLARRDDPMLVKPILPDELLASLRQDSPVPDPGERVARKAPRERLLVVDDSPVNRTVIRDLLLGVGFRVTTAADGPEAVRAAAGDPAPDVVLMDLQMPGMDGIETAQKIRCQSAAAGRTPPPIIALTAHATEQHRRQCLEAGMAGYVTKPARREILLAAIDHALAMPPSGAPEIASAQAPPADTADPEWVRHFHEQTGRPDPEGLRSMAEMFLQEVPARVRGLEQALAAGDARAVYRHGHSLKSCLRYVSSGPEVELAHQIEMAGKAERLEEAATLLAAARPATEAWCRRVRQWRQATRPPDSDS